MAKLTFAQKFKESNPFKEAVGNLQREAILRLCGLDPEELVAAYDSNTGRINVDLSHIGPAAGAPSAPSEPSTTEQKPKPKTTTRRTTKK